MQSRRQEVAEVDETVALDGEPATAACEVDDGDAMPCTGTP